MEIFYLQLSACFVIEALRRDEICDCQFRDVSSISYSACRCVRTMQKVTLTLNAARRFRYTLDFKKHEEQQRLKTDPATRLRAGTHVIRVRVDPYQYIAYLV